MGNPSLILCNDQLTGKFLNQVVWIVSPGVLASEGWSVGNVYILNNHLNIGHLAQYLTNNHVCRVKFWRGMCLFTGKFLTFAMSENQSS